MAKWYNFIWFFFGHLICTGYTQSEEQTVAPLAAGEKNCADYGTSVGRLEWRLWREANEAVARCTLRDAAANLNYAIYWTRAKEFETEKVVLECLDPLLTRGEVGELSCDYRPRDDREGHAVCFVKTYGAGGGSRTRCASDEVRLDAMGIEPKRILKQVNATTFRVSTPSAFSVHAVKMRHFARPQRAQPDLDINLWTTPGLEESSTHLAVLPLQDIVRVITRPPRYRPKLRELPDRNTEKTDDAYPATDLADVQTNTDAVEPPIDLVSATMDPFTQAPPVAYESDTVTPPSNPRAHQRFIPLQQSTMAPPGNETFTKDAPLPDVFNVEGWHMRLILVVVSMIALLVAGSTIGTVLALKFHNRGRDCCDAECCQPCGGRIER